MFCVCFVLLWSLKKQTGQTDSSVHLKTAVSQQGVLLGNHESLLQYLSKQQTILCTPTSRNPTDLQIKFQGKYLSTESSSFGSFPFPGCEVTAPGTILR